MPRAEARRFARRDWRDEPGVGLTGLVTVLATLWILGTLASLVAPGATAFFHRTYTTIARELGAAEGPAGMFTVAGFLLCVVGLFLTAIREATEWLTALRVYLHVRRQLASENERSLGAY